MRETSIGDMQSTKTIADRTEGKSQGTVRGEILILSLPKMIINSNDKIEQALTKLSKHQRRVLLWLLKNTESLELRMDQRGLESLEQGIDWNVAPVNRSLRSSISRSLARLESRDLIKRIAPNGRTIRVKLTLLGKLVALKLKADSS